MVKTKDKKEKRIIPLRQPGKSVETNDDRPSKLLFDEVLRQTEAIPDQDQTQTSTEPKPDPDQPIKNLKPSSKITKQPAPVRDYNKRANSIDRDALPLGYFPGASKKIYDAIYLRTRGAVVPTRTIQATRRELMDWSGIQNIKTINAHLKRLKESGLLKIMNFVGEQSGSTYEVFLPEEIGLDLDQTQTRPEPVPVPNPDQKMDSDQYQKMVWVGSGKSVENKATSEDSKTFFKTLTWIDDDAPVVSALNKLNAAAQAATGKDLTRKDLEALIEIFEMIVDETTIAKSRTKSVSVYLKFAAENLRRRLYPKVPARNTREKGKSTSLEVGKSQTAPEPLGEYRTEVLESFRNMAATKGAEVLEVFRNGYRDEDWNWLMDNLEAGSNE